MDVKKALTTAALTTCTSANYAAVKEPCRSCHSRSLIGFVPPQGNRARQLEKSLDLWEYSKWKWYIYCFITLCWIFQWLKLKISQIQSTCNQWWAIAKVWGHLGHVHSWRTNCESSLIGILQTMWLCVTLCQSNAIQDFWNLPLHSCLAAVQASAFKILHCVESRFRTKQKDLNFHFFK